MPELPEVETMVRGVRPVAEGRIIADMEFCPCERRPLQVSPNPARFMQQVRQMLIARVHRLAKRIVIDLKPIESQPCPTGHKAAESAATCHIVIEPRMTGLLLVSEPPTVEHRRICWHLNQAPPAHPQTFATKNAKRNLPTSRTNPVLKHESGHPHWHNRFEFWDRRGLGTVRLLDQQEMLQLQKTLGIDALQIQASQWSTLFESSTRPIKVALLDQSIVAGIGNLYASEILHLAHIHPQRKCCEIRKSEWNRIQQATQSILQDAIRYEGSTLGDGTYRNALNKDGSYQNKHRVYQKADEVCSLCGKARILRIIQSQRSTFFCPRCQK